MNVETRVQPSDIVVPGGVQGPVDEGVGSADFPNALRGAMEDAGSQEGAPENADLSREHGQGPSENFAGSDGSSELDVAQDETPSEETAVAFVAREAGGAPEEEGTIADISGGSGDGAAVDVTEQGLAESGAALSRPRTYARAGAGAGAASGAGERASVGSEAEFVSAEGREGASTARDVRLGDATGDRSAQTDEEELALQNRMRGGTLSGSGTDAEAVEIEPASRLASAESGDLEALARSSADAPEGRAVSSESDSELRRRMISQAAQAERANPLNPPPVEAAQTSEQATARSVDRGAEVAALPQAPSDSAASPDGEPSPRAGENGERESSSFGDSESSNPSRDSPDRPEFAEKNEAAAIGEQPEVRAAAEAEAVAAAAAANASIAFERVSPEVAGVTVAGAAAVNAPETSAAPTAPTANAPQPAAASDAIAVQTEWLATRGGGSARLRLHPAELGEIEIRVNLRGGVVDVVMVAQEAATHTLAEEQSERLAQAFAQRDLRMDGFEVRRGDSNFDAGEAGGEFAGSSQQGEERSRQEARQSGRDNDAVNEAGARSASSTPVMPQIVTTGPEASVDLRI